MTTALRRDGERSARPQLWRVTDRAAFQQLRRSGHRARRGPVSVTYLPPAPSAVTAPPQVAFSIGRSAGGAVVRNRIRRRLRSGLRSLQAAGHLPAGAYLLSGGSELAHLPWTELVAFLEDAVAAATEAVA